MADLYNETQVLLDFDIEGVRYQIAPGQIQENVQERIAEAIVLRGIPLTRLIQSAPKPKPVPKKKK